MVLDIDTWSLELEAFLLLEDGVPCLLKVFANLHQADSNGVVFFPQLTFLGEGQGQHAEERDKRSPRAWRLAASDLLATQFAPCWWVKGLSKNSITTGGKPGRAGFWEASQWRGERQSLSQSGWYPLPRGGPWADITAVGRCQVCVRELLVLWWSTAFNCASIRRFFGLSKTVLNRNRSRKQAPTGPWRAFSFWLLC